MVLLILIALALLVAVLFRYYLKRKSYARESIQAGDPNKNPLQGMNFSKRGWTFADIADFEFLLLSERHADRVEASQRDRKIYLELVNNAPPDAVREEIDLLRSWLEARRHLGGTYLGGEDLVSSWKLLITATVLCSFVAGAGHASGVLLLLDQGGHVSAIKAVFWTVGVQLAITVFGIAIWGVRNILLRFFGEFSSLRLAIARAVLPLLARRGRSKFVRYLEELSEVERNYRSLVLSHVVIGAQSCVIAMSLGMVTSFELYHYVSEDVRFGWSATRSLEDEEMHKIVQAISFPWRFVEVGHPTLNQIADSRLNRDMSPHTVSKEASQAWASFLTMSIFAYGLTLRLIILVFAARHLGKESKAPLLKGPPVEDLKLRMTTELEPTLIPPNRGLLPSTQNWWQIMRRGKK